MTTMMDSAPTSPRDHRSRRAAGFIVAIGGAVAGLAIAGRSMLAQSTTTFAHLYWPWLALAVIFEAGSMAAFARTQRRVLRAGGSNVTLGSVMAVTYAGNAISASLPLAGSEMATAFTFRQFNRRGIDGAVVGWTLAVCGIYSSLAFALVLSGGALASQSAAAAMLGCVGALVSLTPTVAVLAALRFPRIRRALNHAFSRLVGATQRVVRGSDGGTHDALERFLDRVAALRLSRGQAASILALATWNWVADCLCLAATIKATGTLVPWQGLFLAYGAGMAAASFGLTPGGLGIVEATLSAALVAAGISGHRALAAVLVYRLISFWLVMVAGWTVMAVMTRRASTRESRATEWPDDHQIR
jgi:uncharacterized protein (TIRG00374 family)